MTFVTFIYRLGSDERTYYGKCWLHNMSDDHNGLDAEVQPYLVQGINKYRKMKHLPVVKEEEIFIGIMSFSFEHIIPVYSESYERECKCFDFFRYYEAKYEKNYLKITEDIMYVHGNKFDYELDYDEDETDADYEEEAAHKITSPHEEEEVEKEEESDGRVEENQEVCDEA